MISFICVSKLAFSGTPLESSAQENADAFFMSIIEGDLEKAYNYTSGSFEYTSGSSKEFKSISSKKDMLTEGRKLFNDEFVSELKKARDFSVTCCTSNYYAWFSDNGIYAYFNGDGTPYRIISYFVIKPSFDCIKSMSPTEKKICSSAHLADIDMEISNIYAEIQRLMTGESIQELRTRQRAFLKTRDKCLENSLCISNQYKKQKKVLYEFQDNEFSKAEPEQIVDYSEFNGLWKSVDYKSAANCGKYSDQELNSETDIELYIKYPNSIVSIKDIVDEEVRTAQCTISKVHTETYARVYQRTAYSNNLFGSCGGDIFNMPYSGRYVLLDLSYIEQSGKSCGHIVFTGHAGGKLKAVYGSYLYDDTLITSGSILKKVH